ncbi:hypothetical protein DYB32_010792 [Aphanomyces invadans]|uniref:Ubiquitin-like domain-containing protein n=1 Tax=Aphanomyces invadans TaxID=157072 RepID=A0A418AF33_9STRA|nr:hypothetical protein DYB32_010792 [Aphanomyces invadans]
MALDTTSSILDLKTHVERLSGVAVRSQRLLFKGKYPPDDSVLSSLLSTLKTTSKLVFMLLFDERHHVRMDIQTTTEDLVKECADHMAHLARLKAQISKNFFDASDIGLQLRELLDAVDILASNVDIANDAAPSEDLCRLSTKAVALRDAVALVLDTLFARRT